MVLTPAGALVPTIPRIDESDLRRIASLTAREHEVLCLLGRGLTNREIAEALVVEESTAKCHVARVLTKTGTRNRVEAAVLILCCELARAGIRPAS